MGGFYRKKSNFYTKEKENKIGKNIFRWISVSTGRRKKGSVQRRPKPQNSANVQITSLLPKIYMRARRGLPSLFFSSHTFSIQIDGPDPTPANRLEHYSIPSRTIRTNRKTDPSSLHDNAACTSSFLFSPFPSLHLILVLVLYHICLRRQRL